MNGRANDTAGFPQTLTAETLRSFITTERGCTHPRVGEINGQRFIAKCGSWSEYSSDGHVHNEIVADNLLRMAGLNVPASREYRVDFHDGCGEQTVRLAAYGDGLRPIMEAWDGDDAPLREKIRAQAIAAVNLGGDSDSIGAVYGQLAGAFYGFDAIPDRWVKAVKTWGKVDALVERFLDAVES